MPEHTHVPRRATPFFSRCFFCKRCTERGPACETETALPDKLPSHRLWYKILWNRPHFGGGRKMQSWPLLSWMGGGRAGRALPLPGSQRPNSPCWSKLFFPRSETLSAYFPSNIMCSSQTLLSDKILNSLSNACFVCPKIWLSLRLAPLAVLWHCQTSGHWVARNTL